MISVEGLFFTTIYCFHIIIRRPLYFKTILFESWCHNGLEPFAVNINEATKQSKIIRIVLLKDYMAFEEQLRTEGG
ncbi:hypothetical protein [Bacillus paramycoides]|uniref:hypothetical protein n=1 Tax=Bacillus paramycoides TaxID=2026194 RepID=UPI002244E5A1|nr:hypothetical protein [Bacillus paramycoides]